MLSSPLPSGKKISSDQLTRAESQSRVMKKDGQKEETKFQLDIFKIAVS